jgi:hypothetical protein
MFCLLLAACRHVVPPPPPPAPQKRVQVGVNYKPLTLEMLKDIEAHAAKNGKSIEDIKFFLSSDVRLLRSEDGEDLDIYTDTAEQDKYGVIYRSKMQNYETIVIPKDLSGFYLDDPKNLSLDRGAVTLGISFDPNSRNLLYFMQDTKNSKSYFYLKPLDRNSVMQFYNDRNGHEAVLRINYGGKEYFAASGEIPYLMVQIVDEDNEIEKTIMQLEGRKTKPVSEQKSTKSGKNAAVTMGLTNE